MKVRRTKPPKASPTFERINEELRKECAETTESAKRIIEASKRLTDESHHLIEQVQRHKRKAS